ncbi:MAG: helix-turn-helix domain-containing protein [Sphaerochaetaceae bacterium]|jgi:transposase-like protein|nr:helix-turn-helix domain-containing protein [Sphaerochaetaceae bacterium]
MGRKRRTFSNELKAKVALEALQGQKTISQIAQEYNIHPNMVTNWKDAFINAGTEGLKSQRGKKAAKDEQARKELSDNMLRKLGKQAVEIEFLKKKHREMNSTVPDTLNLEDL